MFQPSSAVVQESSQPLSSRFFQSRSGSSPAVKIEERRMKNDRSVSPDNSAKDRFKGAKQLFMSLERKRKEEKKVSPQRQKLSSNNQKNAQNNIDKILNRELSELDLRKDDDHVDGPARWSRYEQEQSAESRWPKSDRDTGYVSRYSRDKSRSRDFDDSPPSARPNIFVKSGKKSSGDSKLQSKRLSRFLSRETLESDGYDHIEEFEPEPEKQRAKVKRQSSRTSLNMRQRSSSRDPVRDDSDILGGPPEPRRGFLRREMTELDMKGYMQSKAGDNSGFTKKFSGPVWPGMSRERALSPGRPRYPDQDDVSRYHHPPTKVLMPEFRGHHPDNNRYPSLDLRTEKRKSMYEGGGDVLSRRQEQARRHYPEHNNDYRRRSYHELSEVDKIDHAAAARNFQHSGRKMCPDPIGLPARGARGQAGYRIIPDQQRYPGLDRENSRHGPTAFKNTLYHPNSSGPPARGPRSFDHPASRPAMFRHSYAEPSPMHHQYPPGHPHGRFGLASLKPY